ncbi:MAG TPA: polymerase, partial [Clostridiaceae bacterium]|nr:polymerase [Clostridiaceae bacterium]
AIQESPVKGTGLGGFPAAYAKAQMEYFKNGKTNETEKLVAGSPEYAFNEYLQIFLEQGLFGFILFLLLSFLIIKGGTRDNQIGAAGSFIGLSVFALASYPYHLWQFPVVWVLLGTVCTTGNNRETCSKKQTGRGRIIFSILLVVVLGFASTVCISRQKVIYNAKKEWKRLQPFYTVKAYDKVVESYDSLYTVLNFDQKFVFEYGMILNATNMRVKANCVFSRGVEISCDPMFYNVKGRNYHEMKEYKKAEECYTHSIELLPERIYPYYLLTRLYADPANYQPDKMWKAAQAVLEKEPKVHSVAIHEMRDEVNKILIEKEAINER